MLQVCCKVTLITIITKIPQYGNCYQTSYNPGKEENLKTKMKNFKSFCNHYITWYEMLDLMTQFEIE